MTLFEEIGEQGILAVLSDLYTQLFADPMVGFLFEGHDKEHLVAMQAIFTRRFLGDAAAVYEGKSIPDAHAALPILSGHFDRRHHLLAQTLVAHGVADRVREHWLAVDRGLRSSVLKVGQSRVEELRAPPAEPPSIDREASPLRVSFPEGGLVPAVAQDASTGEVRMVAYMNAEALAATLRDGHATFFSRSRGRLWKKGETSGHLLVVRGVFVDCDEDTILLLVDPQGPSCHTGRPTCFFRSVGEDGSVRETAIPAAPFLLQLEQEIAQRDASSASASYTKSLLVGGPTAIAAKIREEADELARAIEGEAPTRVVGEAADLIYHALVGLRARGVALRDVVAELARRGGTSGHAEKARRSRTGG